ncbi:MAG: alpha/beta hydrolase, partial [Gammaproteobacteria bacterium]
VLCLLFAVPTPAGQETQTDQRKTQVEQLEKYLDRELELQNQQRAGRWRRDFTSIKNYIASVNPNRTRLIQAIGGISTAKTPLAPRRIREGETASYLIDRVWLQALPGVETYGILLTPRRIPPNRAPALICLHGMGSFPEQVSGLLAEPDYTRRFGARAAEQGYVVFAAWMTNEVRTKSRLDRKAILLDTRLQGIEEGKILRAIDYLQSLPEVDPKRIGVYGISWGGRTAMYAAAIDERISATVISGHFNENLPKMVTASPHYTAYIDTAEDYAVFRGLAREFSDADVASLIAPRPVYIEQGRADRVVHYPMAQAEFQRLKSIYERLGVGDRAEFGLFEGGHIVHGEGAFAFLRRHLMPPQSR